MMKKWIMVLCIFIFGAVLFTGCEKEKVFISNEIIQDSEQWYGKVITLSDFPDDKVLDVSYADTINASLSSGDVGSTPETAIVPLVFDRQTLVLYTAKRFNQEMDEYLTNGKSMDIVEYLTDMKTFHEVTGLEQAHPKYAQPMPGPNDQAIWSFDPYVKFFTKYDGYREKQSIDQRIIDMVQKATNDPVLQKEIQEELHFLVDYNYVQIDDVVIEFHTGPDAFTEVDYQGIKNEFIYVHGGVMKDMMIKRDQVRGFMEKHEL
jgi:hypothetical protein